MHERSLRLNAAIVDISTKEEKTALILAARQFFTIAGEAMIDGAISDTEVVSYVPLAELEEAHKGLLRALGPYEDVEV